MHSASEALGGPKIQYWNKRKIKLRNAVTGIIKKLLSVRYVEVNIKWSKHKELGRCSIDMRGEKLIFTFKLPREGMTTEDLAVSCVEIFSMNLPIYTGFSILGFLIAALSYYLLPQDMGELVSLVFIAFSIATVLMAAIILHRHERNLKIIKQYYLKLARSDLLSMRMYSLIVDMISWMLRECRGKPNALIKSSKLLSLIKKYYGELLEELDIHV